MTSSRTVLVTAITLVALVSGVPAAHSGTSLNAAPGSVATSSAPNPKPRPPGPPSAKMDNHRASSFANSPSNLSNSNDEDGGIHQPPKPVTSPRVDAQANDTAVKVKNAPKKQKVDVRSESCTNMGVRQCAAAQTGCMTDAGGRDQYKPPTITWVRVDGGEWEYAGLSCGPPTSVEVPGASGGPVEVEVEAPPVPTLGQIQTAFRALPFSKPSVKVQPKGQRTAKNLKTFYAARWPSDEDLQPGEVSKPVKLLSWSVEFKVAARDYRYSYGDGTSSGWTSSTGGTYPDGDITHTYSEAGDVEVKVDARLTGQYRVNGGQWQDIATVADLQDEPSFTLEVRGTKTTLVDN